MWKKLDSSLVLPGRRPLAWKEWGRSVLGRHLAAGTSAELCVVVQV